MGSGPKPTSSAKTSATSSTPATTATVAGRLRAAILVDFFLSHLVLLLQTVKAVMELSNQIDGGATLKISRQKGYQVFPMNMGRHTAHNPVQSGSMQMAPLTSLRLSFLLTTTENGSAGKVHTC